MGRVGSAQKRALLALFEGPEGVGEVPFLSAPGLINKGLVRSLGRAHLRPNAPYVCALTDAGGRYVAELLKRERTPGQAPGENPARQIGRPA